MLRNLGELAEGWYDPNTKSKADQALRAASRPDADRAVPEDSGTETRVLDDDVAGEFSDYGPSPAPAGASIPSMDDIALRDELTSEQHNQRRRELRDARMVDRKRQRERLEEPAPRAEAGTKERVLEKKREAGALARVYREGADAAGEMEDIREPDLMGIGEDTRALKHREERKKNEREMRREEILRARAEEREVRVRGLKEKEDRTIERLRSLAWERFGSG